uniref:Uncharacterized protein n=1 Tax=Rhizophora mucronata TaxID=61149 RepID=A0A2P2IU05_RHIMU
MLSLKQKMILIAVSCDEKY